VTYFADFAVCTFPNGISTISIQRIEYDIDFVSSCIRKSSALYEIAILPEMLGQWYTRSQVMPVEDDSNSAEYKYCYSKEEQGDTMIHCDNDNCPDGEWFHLTCLKLQKVLHSKTWLCPTCWKVTKVQVDAK